MFVAILGGGRVEGNVSGAPHFNASCSLSSVRHARVHEELEAIMTASHVAQNQEIGIEKLEV
jgi:hypothetical protein